MKTPFRGLRCSWYEERSFVSAKRRVRHTGASATTSALDPDSPASKYAQFKDSQKLARTITAQFASGFDFEFDEFQTTACLALEQGKDVLVAAPTGAGKTIVAEFAVHLALEKGLRVFYTAPIKALSNQKYADFCARYGAEKVGLLTGDSSINGEAPCVVMTTEVLRNMLYAASSSLNSLGFVIMDEVHYLADRFRGPVWEEVIIHLPAEVRVASLSATVSNAEEFGAWLGEVRGPTEVVVSEHRPVPLYQHMMVGRRLFPLYAGKQASEFADFTSTLNVGLLEAINQAQAPVVQQSFGGRSRSRSQFARGRNWQDGKRAVGRHAGRAGYGAPRRAGRILPPRRISVIEELERRELLPAIVFVFSRAGCEAARSDLLRQGLDLTSAEQKAAIDAHVEQAFSSIPAEDWAVLGLAEMVEALRSGVGVHHAGLLPIVKECVEKLFCRGLLQVVFATETLALGINMPAKTVVIESLRKWDGSAHVNLTAGEYTQLTGRAGRRGIDTEGHGVVLYQDGVDPGGVAALASKRTYPLRSAFRPTYNMAVNLLRYSTYAQARGVLETSFAQFQADGAVVGLARKVKQNEAELALLGSDIKCHLGDFQEYARLRRDIGLAEKTLKQGKSGARRLSVQQALNDCHRGDVISFRQGSQLTVAAVAEVKQSAGRSALLMLIDADNRLIRLGAADNVTELLQLGQMTLPFKGGKYHSPRQRQDVALKLRDSYGRLAGKPKVSNAQIAQMEADLLELKKQLQLHPCHSCPEREDHARQARKWLKADTENSKLLLQIDARTSSIARDFDHVCQVLTELGYLQDSALTLHGDLLAVIYAERDLLVAECLRQGLFNGLNAPQLAGAVSALVFEEREQHEVAGVSNGVLRQVLANMQGVACELAAVERRYGVESLTQVVPSFAQAMYLWASGQSLTQCVEAADMSAGDFVRWARQVLDLLDQLAKLDGCNELAQTARKAVSLIRRSVVEWTGL